jgi:plastocyanin
MVKTIKKELGTWRGKMILFVAICVITSLTLIRMETMTSANLIEGGIRTIELEIRNMTFGVNNPTIDLRPGETVRFVITNLDPGMKHEFNIEGTEVHSRLLRYGDKDSVLFHTPMADEKLVYVCSLHSLKMRGFLHVNNELAFRNN